MGTSEPHLPPPSPGRTAAAGSGLRADHVLWGGGLLLLVLVLVALVVTPRPVRIAPATPSPSEVPAAGVPRRSAALSPVTVERLRQMTEKARQIKTLEMHGIYEVSASGGSSGLQRQGGYRLLFQAPDRLSFSLETGAGLLMNRIVADGSHVVLEMQKVGLAIRLPEPAGTSGPLEAMSAAVPGIQSPLDFFRLAANGFQPDWLESATEGVDARGLGLRDVPAPEDTLTITVRFKHWPETAVWVDRNTGQVRQMVSRLDAAQLATTADRLGGLAPTMFRTLLAPTSVRVLVRQFITAINVPLAQDAFSYTPAEAVTVVDVASWEAARNVLGPRLDAALAQEAQRLQQEALTPWAESGAQQQ